MRVILRDTGWERTIRKITSTGVKRTRRGIRQGFFAIGDDFVREVNNQVLRTRKTGRFYTRRSKSGRKIRHRASAPGESHANRSGDLRKSADYKIHAESMSVGYLDDPPDYDVFVEFGTKKMDPRPTIQNSLRAIERSAQEHLGREIVRAWREGF